MKIRGWFIDGFGHFRDYPVADIGDGLTVFLGPNEAGKTTLLAFVRAMLFGFPDRRGRSSRHEPLRGGRHGGRLMLETSEGHWTLDRNAEGRGALRLTGPGGDGGEEELRRMLGPADAKLFQNVFAFGLTELQSLEALSADGVRDRVYSAGIVGAGRAARQVVAELESRATELFKPRGRTQIIPGLIKTLNDARRAVAEARARAQHYPELVREEEMWSAERARLNEAMLVAQQAARRATLLIDLWPVWNELRDAQERLAALPLIESFPDEPERRLTEWKANTDAAETAVRALEQERQELDARASVARARLTPALDEIARDVAAHLETRDSFRGAAARLQTAREDLARTGDDLAGVLRDLGAGWNEERLAAFDASLPQRDRVRSWQERLRSAAEACREAERRHEAAAAMAARVRREDEEQARRLAQESAGWSAEAGDAVDQQEAAVRRLRVVTAQLREHEHDAERHEALRRERERSLELARTEPVAERGARIALVLGALALLAGAVLVGSTESGPAGILAFAVLLGAVIAVHRVQEAGRRAAADRARHAAEQRQVVAGELARASEARDHALGRAADVRAAIELEAARLGVSAHPSPDELEEHAQLVMRRREEGLRRRQLIELREAAAWRLAEAERELADRVRPVDAARAALSELRQDWDTWKRQVGLPEELAPDAVLDFTQAVHRARERVAARDKARAAAQHLAAEVSAWEQRARQLAVQGGVSDAHALCGEELVAALRDVHGRCEQHADTRRALATIDAEASKLRARREAATRELQRLRETGDALFESAGARDETDYRIRMRTLVERREIELQLLRLERQISDRLGAGLEAEASRAALANGALGDWKRELERSQREALILEQEREAAIRSHRDAQRAREELEISADVPSCEAAEEAVLTELRQATEQWRVLTLAQSLVVRTLADYTRTRQPAVLSEAARALSRVTGGHYVGLTQQEGGEAIAVVNRRGESLAPESLSRGTAEQLYVCLRLALAAEFAKNGAQLPLVLDDVCVNFDPERARAIAEVIAEFAREHQVLFFTCHPTTVEMLRDVSPGLRVHDMPRHATPAPPAPERAAPAELTPVT